MGNDNLFEKFQNSGECDNSPRKQRANVKIILSLAPTDVKCFYKLHCIEKETVYKISLPFLKVLSEVRWDVSRDMEEAQRVEFKSQISSILQKISKSKKDDYIGFIYDVLYEPKNVAQIVHFFPEQIKAALRVLAVKRWTKIADYPELIRLYPNVPKSPRDIAIVDVKDILLYADKQESSRGIVIADEYDLYASLFNLDISYFSDEYYVGLNIYLMNMLSRCFLEDNPTLETIEKPQTMFTFNAYPLLATEIPKIDWYFRIMHNIIEGKDFTVTLVKDFAKGANIQEFFTDKCMAAEYRRMRAVILATLWNCMEGSTKSVPEYEENVLSALSKAINRKIMKDVLYSNVRRPHRYILDLEEFASEVIKYISKNCSQGWYSPDDLLDVVVRGKQFSRQMAYLFAVVERQTRYYTFYNEYTNKYIYCHDAIAVVAATLIYATVFVLAAVGLVEIAYDFPLTDQASGFAGLKAFRLSSFGLHVFCYKSEYVRNEVERERMQLEDSALLIKVSSNDIIGFDFVKVISVKVSKNLYKVTSETFLNNCAGNVDLLRRIQTFESLFGQDIPEIWKNFFAELNSKACLLENVTEDNYIVLQLKKDDAELMRILTENTVIRKISQRATGKIVLVKAKDYDKFCCELSKYGYLL